MQAKAERDFAARRAMTVARRLGNVSHAMTAEAWMQEALRTKPDARTGILQGWSPQYHLLQEHACLIFAHFDNFWGSLFEYSCLISLPHV